MALRSVLVVLLTCGLAGFSLAQPPVEKPAKPDEKKPMDLPGGKKSAPGANVDEHLEAVEKQLAVLLKEVQALRQEVWKNRLQLLESAVAMGRERVDWLERMTKKGYAAASQVEAELKVVEQAQEMLKKAKEELRRLTQDERKPPPSAEKPRP
jgi:cell division septum initiation protein DivIVA